MLSNNCSQFYCNVYNYRILFYPKHPRHPHCATVKSYASKNFVHFCLYYLCFCSIYLFILLTSTILYFGGDTKLSDKVQMSSGKKFLRSATKRSWLSFTFDTCSLRQNITRLRQSIRRVRESWSYDRQYYVRERQFRTCVGPIIEVQSTCICMCVFFKIFVTLLFIWKWQTILII